MMKIWKFPLKIGRTEVKMSEGAKVLDVQLQNGKLIAWVTADWDRPRVTRKFQMVGTGHEVPEGAIATVQGEVFGPYTWHIFEVV